MAAATLWDVVRDAAAEADRRGLGLWTWLREKIAFAQYRPEAADGVEVSQLTGRDGDYYVLKNPQTRTYYRLSDRDHFLWQRMDGTQTVKDLVVAYFLEFGSFAFGRVATAVEGLKSQLLLTDRPVQVYQKVRSRLEGRRVSHRLECVWQTFMQKEFAVSGLDHLMQGIYGWGGRLLFTRPMQAIFLAVSVVGLYLFARVLGTGSYGLVTIGGSYRLGVIGLVAANLVAILVHELSHALTVKHYGRELRRGGFMLYFGLPAFFMDTMDIWMEGKRARLAVTWAGPYSGLILGGLASTVITVWPEFSLNALLFQFAFFGYLTVFFNLNPLLELDGYFLLMDALEIPMLRQKSLAFIRRGLWEKLAGVREAGQTVRERLASFSREEKIFTVFGGLSALWTAYAIFSGVRLWQQRLAGVVGDLWTKGGVGRAILALAVAAIGLLFVASLGMALFRVVRRFVRWLARKGLFARTGNVALILLAVALAIILLPGYLGYAVLVPAFAMLTVIAAAFLAWRNAEYYAGSRLAGAFWLLAAYTSALLLRTLLPLVSEGISSTSLGAYAPRAGVVGVVTAGLEYFGYGTLIGVGLILFDNTDLRELRPSAKLLMALGMAASYGLVLVVSDRSQGGGLLGAGPMLTVIRGLVPLLTLIMLLPTLFSYWGTGFGPAWTMIGLGLATQVAGSLLDWSLLSSHVFLAAGLLLHYLAYWQVAVPRDQPEPDLELSDRGRLRRAFCWTVASVFSQFRQIAGERRARQLAEKLNTYALAARWQLSLVQGEVNDVGLAEESVIEQGARYADALSLFLDMVAKQAGENLTVRTLQRGYDHLPWEEREIGAQYLFRDVKRAEVLSRDFRSVQRDYRALLRRNPLFYTMDDDEIDLLVSRLKLEQYSPEQVVIRQGDAGDAFYIVKRGHVEVTQRDERGVSELVNHLDRGDYFGELALLHDAPRNATCRATVPTELLSLSRPDFDSLVRARFALRQKVGRSVARADLLRRMPLFAELDAHQVQLIAAQLQEEDYEPGAVLIRQGEIGKTFYVIESGLVQVAVEEDGDENVVVERGPGEYVGEIALLLDVPRTATVTAAMPVRVLSLHRDDFDRLVSEHLFVSEGLQRETSRRMMDLQRVAAAA
ncbi:MAG: cyclic nucleotide-binding domain-containing protein [Anaerolineae bacterium]